LNQLATNPATGQIEKERITEILANLDKYDQQLQLGFLNFEDNLKRERPKDKYTNMLSQYYVTGYEAMREYQAQISKANISYVVVPFSTIADSTIDVSDQELKDMYQKRKERFKRERPMVTLQYVLFPYAPTAADVAKAENAAKDLADDFKVSQDDVAFATASSDTPGDPVIEGSLGDFPYVIPADHRNNLEQGKVLGPYREGKKFRVFKVSKLLEDDSLFSARASHILIKSDGRSDAEAQKLIQDAMKRVQGGETFDKVAREVSEDGSKSVGGDLGVFKEGAMVKEFNDAVFSATQLGMIKRVIKTQFGYHLIDVTQLKSKKKYQLVAVDVLISADELREETFQKAANFTLVNKIDAFKDSVDANPELQRNRQIAANLTQDAYALNNVQDPEVRNVLRWAFDKSTAEGVVSQEVYEFEEKFMVVALSERMEEGYKPLTDPEVERLVRIEVAKDKKAKMITEKLQKANTKDLDALAAAYGQGATVHKDQAITMNSFAIAGAGVAPKTIGRAFTMQQGQTTDVFADDNAVMVVSLVSLEPAPSIADYNVYKQQIVRSRQQRVPQDIEAVLTEFAEVKKDFYKFF